MDQRLKANLTSGDHWARFIYMLLFAVFLYIANMLAALLVVVQFVFALLTGSPNVRLRGFGAEVTQYIHQIWRFLTYNSEEKAYPFADWPSVAPGVDDLPVTADEVAAEPPATPAAVAPSNTKKRKPAAAVDEPAETDSPITKSEP